MKKFIITTEQKEKLKNILTEEEFRNLCPLVWDDFFVELNECTILRFNEDDEPTDISNQLEDIYFEILNQNS